MSNDINEDNFGEILTDEKGDYMLRHGVELTVEVHTIIENEEGQHELGASTGLSFTVQHGTGRFSDGSSRQYMIDDVSRKNRFFAKLTDQLIELENGWNFNEQNIKLHTMDHEFPTNDNPFEWNTPTCFGHWLQNEASNAIQFYTRPGGKLVAAGMPVPTKDELDKWVPHPKTYQYTLSRIDLPSE